MILDPSVGQQAQAIGEPVDQVSFRTAQGLHQEGQLVSLAPYSACFEICGPDPGLKTSEVLEEFNVRSSSRSIYRGKATVKTLTPMGGVFGCEVVLDTTYTPLDLGQLDRPKVFAGTGFEAFLGHWSKFHQVLPDYKSAVAEMECFLHDLKLWLDEIELGIRALPNGERAQTETAFVEELARNISLTLATLFERFEMAATHVDAELLPAHFAYCRRALHPYLLTSPFMYRIFAKPLGYAGDYEMVDMILRNRPEGGSVFAKVLNLFILSQIPAVAHRNRVDYLTNKLVAESHRRVRVGGKCRVFNLGCGPAGEVQEFLAQSELSRDAEFTLLDANQETLEYAERKLRQTSERHGRRPLLKMVKKSVQQTIKQSARPRGEVDEFDFIYSAGLFDYLNDRVCKVLIEHCYSRLAPGGLLLVTNVDRSNPIRNIMEHLYDWYLIYRDGSHMERLAAGLPGNPEVRVHAELTSSNLFLEVRKPAALQ